MDGHLSIVSPHSLCWRPNITWKCTVSEDNAWWYVYDFDRVVLRRYQHNIQSAMVCYWCRFLTNGKWPIITNYPGVTLSHGYRRKCVGSSSLPALTLAKWKFWHANQGGHTMVSRRETNSNCQFKCGLVHLSHIYLQNTILFTHEENISFSPHFPDHLCMFFRDLTRSSGIIR